MLWGLGDPCSRDVATDAQRTMSLVGRCKDQEIPHEPGGTAHEILFLWGLEEIKVQSRIPGGTLLEVLWEHDKGVHESGNDSRVTGFQVPSFNFGSQEFLGRPSL